MVINIWDWLANIGLFGFITYFLANYGFKLFMAIMNWKRENEFRKEEAVSKRKSEEDEQKHQIEMMTKRQEAEQELQKENQRFREELNDKNIEAEKKRIKEEVQLNINADLVKHIKTVILPELNIKTDHYYRSMFSPASVGDYDLWQEYSTEAHVDVYLYLMQSKVYLKHDLYDQLIKDIDKLLDAGNKYKNAYSTFRGLPNGHNQLDIWQQSMLDNEEKADELIEEVRTQIGKTMHDLSDLE